MGPITQPNWISLRDAAILAAREMLGEDPPENLFDSPDVHERLLLDIRSDIRSALCSNAVTCLVDGGDGVGIASIEKLRHFATTFDVNNSTIVFEGHSEWRFPAVVNLSEFKNFLKLRRGSRRGSVAAHNRDASCRDWLEQELSRGSRSTKPELRESGKERFGISGRGFNQIWAQLAATQEFSYISRGGRPPKPTH